VISQRLMKEKLLIYFEKHPGNKRYGRRHRLYFQIALFFQQIL